MVRKECHTKYITCDQGILDERNPCSRVISRPFHIMIFKMVVALISLTLGGLAYVIFRPKSLVMFDWFEQMGIMPFVNQLRQEYGSITLNDFWLNSVPAGLWLFSYLYVIDSIWQQKNLLYKYFLYLLPFAAIASEFLQLTSLVPGTFDIVDVLCYLLAFLTFLIIKHAEK